MIGRNIRIGGFLAFCLGLAGTALLTANQGFDPRSNRVPMVQDWSHRHLIFSHPQSIIRNLQVQQQTRYAQQVYSRNFAPRNPIGRRPISHPFRFEPTPVNNIHRDWQVLMPGAGYTMGDGNFPAKYQFDITATPDCTHDFIVFTTSQAAGGATDIYALNQLYPGTCTSGAVPNLLWAYHVQSHAGGAAITSPVLSLDGTQVAWVEGKGGTAALHILKPYTGGGAGTLSAPATIVPSLTASAFRACTPTSVNHGCVFSIDFTGSADDTGASGAITPASPYYDYPTDSIFVGDDNGVLHLFQGIFNGNPAEVTGGSTGWPFTVHSGSALTSAVYDQGSGSVFVGDSSGQLSYVSVAPGTLNASAGARSWTIGTSITDAPVVDGTIGNVFVFARNSGTGALVGEDDVTLAIANRRTVSVGASDTSLFHSGAFDNAYYNTDIGPGTGTGDLYVCGNTGSNLPELYQIAVTNGIIGTAAAQFTAATASTECSPVTEFYNPTTSTDSVFFSVQASATGSTSCTGDGCIFGENVTGGAVTLSGAIPASGGASGIVVDNDSALAGGTNLYYTWLGNSAAPAATYGCNGDTSGKGCTIQVAQLGLGSAGLVVQTDDTDGGSVPSTNVFWNNPVKPGNMILAFAHWGGGAGDQTITATLTDAAGNTYIPIGSPINVGATNVMQAWYAKNIVSSGNKKVTITFSRAPAAYSVLDVVEYSGLDTVAPLDTTSYASAIGNGKSLSSGPSGITNSNNETILGMFVTDQAATPFTSGSGFTQVIVDASTLAENLVVSTTGQYTATATDSNTTNWGAIVVGFKNAIQ